MGFISYPGAVLWDMDGVIVDTDIYHRDAWLETLSRAGIAFTKEDYQHISGMRNEEALREVLGQEFTPERFAAMAAAKEENFRQLIQPHLRLLPGVAQLRQALRSVGFRQALVSSAPMANINLITEMTGMKNLFEVVVSGEDVTEGKPSPQGYLLAARKLGIVPARCVVIEDAPAGVAAAKRGGMKCLAVTNSHPAADLSAADLVVHSLEAVNVKVVSALLHHDYKII